MVIELQRELIKVKQQPGDLKERIRIEEGKGRQGLEDVMVDSPPPSGEKEIELQSLGPLPPLSQPVAAT